jgi:hypothetical protein
MKRQATTESASERRHTGPELRGMITSRQRELEEIAVRCAQGNYESAAENISEACVHLIRAKAKIAKLEGKDRA